MKLTVINHLKRLRTSRGIEVLDMASDLGISTSMIYKMEKLPISPNITLAYSIAKYFGVDVETVFEPVYESPPPATRGLQQQAA